MEDLNKHQLILLTLLVSFVTSIATGIITFTLLQQAPVEITQTINRVVERTIEKVTPEEGKQGQVKEIVTTVVSEEDRVLEAIEKNTRSIVRIRGTGTDGSEVFLGLGLVVSDSGIVIFDKSIYVGGTGYTVLFSDSKSLSISKFYSDPNSNLVFAKVGKPSTEKYTYYPAKFANTSNLKLGQTIIAVGGRDSNTVAIGRIAELQKSLEGGVVKIVSDILPLRNNAGSPLLNLSGEVVGVGLAHSTASDTLVFNPASFIQNGLKDALTDFSK